MNAQEEYALACANQDIADVIPDSGDAVDVLLLVLAMERRGWESRWGRTVWDVTFRRDFGDATVTVAFCGKL